MPFGTRFLQSPSANKNSSKDMEEPDFLDVHNFLADDIIRTREGGTGWMVDLALNADRCNPKTFLLKTRKCSENGSIVLEPALSPENYINPKSVSESKGGFFAAYFTTKRSVSINESLSEELVRTTIVSESSAVSQHKYAFVKSTDARGRVKFRIAPNTGFGASMAGTKSTSSSVEVFCEDLVRKSVDFEDLRSALDEHTVNTSATNIRGEDSLFVVTDVLVAGKISWEVKQNVESKRSGGGNVDVEPVTVAAEGGTSSQRPQEHRQVVNNAVLAFKLAKLSYDSEGKIVGFDKSGSFEGNYTLGPGTEEREGQTAIKLLGSGENGRKGSELFIRYVTQEKRRGQPSRFHVRNSSGQLIPPDVHIDRIPLQCIMERGKYQRKVHEPWQLPLKGLIVRNETADRRSRYRIPWKKRKKERVYLKKVAVTDVQADNTFTCICNSQLDIPKDDWTWVDCKQRRQSLTKNEVRVNIEFEGSVIRTLTVDEEDPIFVIMHGMRDKVPCFKQAFTYKGTKIKYAEDTIKDLGVKDGDQLTLLVKDPERFDDALMIEPPVLRMQGPEKINSIPWEDIQSIIAKYPELKIDEGRVSQILEADRGFLGSRLDDMSPDGFQQLMGALGQKVDFEDILKAMVLHEDNSDEEDQFSVLDMMTASIEGRSWFNDDDPSIDASIADRIASLEDMIPRRRIVFPHEDLQTYRNSRSPKYGCLIVPTASFDAEEDSSQDVGAVMLPGPPKQKTLPIVPGFSEAEVEEASKSLQGLFSEMISEKPELAEKVSEIDWEAVNRRRMNPSAAYMSELINIPAGEDIPKLGPELVQLSGKDKEEEEEGTVISTVDERVQLEPNLPGGASSPMDSSHEPEKFT